MYQPKSSFLLGCLLLIMGAATSTAAEANRPNFIVIIADDMATDDCSPMGHPHIRTPNLQRLANEGLTFDRAFLTCSSCSPSRCSILTSRYPHQTDAEQLHWPLPADQTTFVELLHQAGYFTAASGKWHLGPAPRRGFDRVDEVSSAGFQLAANQAEPTGDAAKLVDEKNASGCAGWLTTLAACPNDQPFFLWLAAVDPHRDYEQGIIDQPHGRDDIVLPPYIPDTPAVRDDFALYYDEITRLDSYVGAVLQALDERGLTDNTYVVFISDNGRPFPRCKTTVFDSGIQTPMFIRRPGHVSAGQRTDALVSSIDIGTTVLELAGVQPGEAMVGQSFTKVLQNPTGAHRTHVFAEHNWHDFDGYQRAVRTERFKYIRNFDSDLPLTPPADAVRSPTFIEMRRLRDAQQLTDVQMQCFTKPRAEEELYDLAADPYELVNVAGKAEYQEELSKLRKLIDDWRSETYDAALTLRSPDEFDRETGAPLPNRKRPRPGKEDGFVPMFNGNDLAGWKPISTPASTWIYQDGLLVCSGRPIGELRTEKMYQNFVLELEWRHMVPGGNAGVFVWADDITARGVPFHRGVEVQVLENDYGNTNSYTTHGDIFPIHGATMIPVNGRGGQRAFPTEMRSHPSPQWNHYRIVCQNGSVSLAVNGKFVTQGHYAWPSKGYICLESEGGVVHYRNVRIKELPDTPITPDQIAITDRGFRCVYLGLDLDQWETKQPELWQVSDWQLIRKSAGSAKPATKLVSLHSSKNSHWIVDVRRSSDAAVRLLVGGTEITSQHPAIAKLISKPGTWDRWEMIRDAGERITVIINGQKVDETFAVSDKSSTQFAIDADDETTFANIYTKVLP